ncbi:TIR domain-containing protein [Mucilaginibacter sp. OK283]|uniref:TIR domain-containing protein n=1 Tax=Mucilaginibacter sp. OK283 TaxID=1881049 RepID=UPI0008B7C697|nr:TIR domain-containing protein [Mucilaginibacter sp. OK283]SEO20263.1 MTH538 TIR-like domain [Mucilaginibacter sp. OK283]
MANPRAFISFDFDHDEGSRRYFVGQSINSTTPFNIEDWSSKSVLPEPLWEMMLEEKIKKCHLVIVLIGRFMSSARGVQKEIRMAERNNIPIFGIYVDGAGLNSNLPLGLSRTRVTPWSWIPIANQIEKCMTEGKNRL